MPSGLVRAKVSMGWTMLSYRVECFVCVAAVLRQNERRIYVSFFVGPRTLPSKDGSRPQTAHVKALRVAGTAWSAEFAASRVSRRFTFAKQVANSGGEPLARLPSRGAVPFSTRLPRETVLRFTPCGNEAETSLIAVYGHRSVFAAMRSQQPVAATHSQRCHSQRCGPQQDIHSASSHHNAHSPTTASRLRGGAPASRTRRRFSERW